jgi:sporulation-control protein spo0M
MSSLKKLRTDIAGAIQKADSSYFFEDYNKQAQAVMKSIENSGFRLMPKDIEESFFKEVADAMRMGKMKPEEHVKDVYFTILRLLEKKG